MLLKLLLLMSFIIPQAQTMEGYGVAYAPGVMERVARNRNMEIAPCMMASPYESIGTVLLVEKATRDENGVFIPTGLTRECMVTDVACDCDMDGDGNIDRVELIRRRVIAEFDFTSAQFFCNVEVLANGKIHYKAARDCPIIVHYQEKSTYRTLTIKPVVIKVQHWSHIKHIHFLELLNL